MKRRPYRIALYFLLLFPFFVSAQVLHPGFDKDEYYELMLVSTRTSNSPSYYQRFPEPAQFNMIYRSPVMGLDNLWDCWLRKDKQVAAISIRGTTQNAESWLANLYAAMVPAKGTLYLDAAHRFEYDLATHPQAAVHVGWLVSMAYLSLDMRPRIDSLYQQGVRDFLIVGHSQGGAIAYLLTAYCYRLQELGKLPADIRFKTYCSAGPKPGNLYFAYDYEAKTQKGWAYNVVNSADWVPEVPMSIQTIRDFNPTNPFVHAKTLIRKQKFPANMALRHVFNQLDKPTRKAQRKYERYLGKMTSKLIRKQLPDLRTPSYVHTNHYVRTGNIIVLLADEDYYKKYPQNSSEVFVHHFHQPYLDLLEKY